MFPFYSNFIRAYDEIVLLKFGIGTWVEEKGRSLINVFEREKKKSKNPDIHQSYLSGFDGFIIFSLKIQKSSILLW